MGSLRRANRRCLETMPIPQEDKREPAPNEAQGPNAGPALPGYRSGVLFVMTGASGVGKDTIRHAAMPKLKDLEFSISATTRGKRAGETDGVEYNFVSRDAFEEMIARDQLLEHADFVGEYYGTPLPPVLAALKEGRDILLELELVGARQVKKRMPEAIMIFIAPPSLAELERRLRGRGTETEEKIGRRLARARDEIRALREFDYLIINDCLEDAAELFERIIHAERARADLVNERLVDKILEQELDDTAGPDCRTLPHTS